MEEEEEERGGEEEQKREELVVMECEAVGREEDEAREDGRDGSEVDAAGKVVCEEDRVEGTDRAEGLEEEDERERTGED